MSEGLVLDPPADLVDHAVGHPCHVERVGDPGGVGKVRGEPGPVGVGQVEGDDLDAPLPPFRPSRRPSSQLGGTSPFEQVDHEASVQVDEDGGEDGRVLSGGGQVAVLVDPERPCRADPVRVVDQGTCRGA